MSPDARLKDLATTLCAASLAAPFERKFPDLPMDVERVLAAVGGATFGDLQFLELSEVEVVRARLVALAADSEAEKSDVAPHALWSPDWYPIARPSPEVYASSSEVYAYAPLGCFRGPPAQIVCLDVEGRACWEGYPSLTFWLGALHAASRGGLEEDVASGARRWAAARGRLFLVELPEAPEAQRSRRRFSDLHRSYPILEGVEIVRPDFTLFVLHALSFARAPSEVLGEIAHALDDAVPHCHLQTLAQAAQDDAAALARSWLVPLLAKHAAKKDVTQLLFGVEPRGDGLVLWVWPCAPGYTPSTAERFESSTPCFEGLNAILCRPEVGFSTEAWTFVAASAALLLRGLLDAAARSLPWEGPLDVVYDRTQLGICDTDGFVPTPLPIARTRLASLREGTAAGMQRMGFEGGPIRFVDHPVPTAEGPATPEGTRRLRHPDGRAWEVVVSGDSFEVTMVESDGERDTFKRRSKTGWEVETMVAAQLRDGFVDS